MRKLIAISARRFDADVIAGAISVARHIGSISLNASQHIRLLLT
jgi:hypothetical protein